MKVKSLLTKMSENDSDIHCSVFNYPAFEKKKKNRRKFLQYKILLLNYGVLNLLSKNLK